MENRDGHFMATYRAKRLLMYTELDFHEHAVPQELKSNVYLC